MTLNFNYIRYWISAIYVIVFSEKSQFSFRKIICNNYIILFNSKIVF